MSREISRLAAHRMLDMMSVAGSETAFKMVTAELAGMGAITAEVDEAGTVDVDLTNLMGGVAFLLVPLIEMLATATGDDRLTVINSVREAVDVPSI